MHILNADVLSSILFSWCKTKLANIINTEKLFVCLQFAYISRFFFLNRQNTDWPTSRGNVPYGAGKKLLGWCCWSCEDNKSHEYQHNIKTLVRDWWLLPPDGKGVKFTRSPLKAFLIFLTGCWMVVYFLYSRLYCVCDHWFPFRSLCKHCDSPQLYSSPSPGNRGVGVGVVGSLRSTLTIPKNLGMSAGITSTLLQYCRVGKKSWSWKLTCGSLMCCQLFLYWHHLRSKT